MSKTKLTLVFYFNLIMTEALCISVSEMQRGIKLQFKFTVMAQT